jgi:hypothetical protein
VFDHQDGSAFAHSLDQLRHTIDIFVAHAGCEHVAHPQGQARILVVEEKGSV